MRGEVLRAPRESAVAIEGRRLFAGATLVAFDDDVAGADVDTPVDLALVAFDDDVAGADVDTPVDLALVAAAGTSPGRRWPGARSPHPSRHHPRAHSPHQQPLPALGEVQVTTSMNRLTAPRHDRYIHSG